MQIHELTKRRKRADEGLLDNIKSAIGAAKTGYAAGKAGTGSTLGAAGTALGTFGKAITDPAFAAQSDKDANANDAMKKYNALKAKYGWKDKDDEAQPSAQTTGTSPAASTQDAQAIKQQAQTMTQQFAQSLQEPDLADLTAVLPDPGKVLYVEMPPQIEGGQPTKYYKDEKGIWYNEDMKALKGGAKNLEQMIDDGKYGQTERPTTAPSAATQPVKAKQPKQPAAATPPAQPAAATQPAQSTSSQPVSEAASPRAQKVNTIIKRIIAKNQKAEQQALNATIDQAKADPKAKAIIDKAYQQVFNATGLTASKAKTRAAKKQAVIKAFSNYANTALTQAAQVGQGQSAGQPGSQGSTSNSVIQANAAQKLATAGILDQPTVEKVKKAVQNPKTKPLVQQAVGLAEQKSLDQRLFEALQELSEAQVHITKDIHVRTAGGDYIKRASDQQWYDPKGVLIDPVKYAEYIAKLDRTPQAQTQYQADERKAAAGKGPGGTDAGFQAQQASQQQAQQQATQQAQEIKQHVPDVDPVAVAAYKQQLMAQLRQGQVSSLNSQIQDTLTQLRNAQIFGTGQEQYLQQQLAGLMATKV